MRLVPFRQVLAVRLKLSNFLLLIGLFLLWYFVFKAFDLYSSRRLSSGWAEAGSVLKATSVCAVILLCAAFLFRLELVTPRFISVFWFSSSAAVVSTRALARLVLGRARLRGRNLRHVLIVGTNTRARNFAARLRSRRDLGYTVLGFVDREWTGLTDFFAQGEKLVAGFDDLLDFLRKSVVDEVVIALPLGSAYHESARILRVCEEQGITVRFLHDIFNLSLAKSRIEVFESKPIITWRTHKIEGGPMVVKRLLDFVVALLLLLVLAPLFAVVAVLIKVTSPGPIFFVQQRVGLNKRIFPLLKFRTMVEDAESRIADLEDQNEASGPVFKIREDPRLTPIGRALRKSSIDELPQLVNVLKGDMSLVGPRPLPLRDYEGFDHDWHRRRLSVRPGITCLWQVGGRSSVAFERWMELDMQYIDEWSLWLDLKILARTIPAVLFGSGAA